ncbi:muscle M-line assembly protein unc-89-like [Coccinella septempunctata]|uniref:muscle M-line assembly protein unc-89-like n=1 Tax=Coccinella septempunctata TaxID=41139 RepID=UPI001D098347|nr:muscle M-line assembly protein unc-89-like [Coccinella septempunctata]
MEISKNQIARLVLGYLKSENCKSAFNEFLLKSQYLKSYALFVKNGKYFATRVGGLTLEDILAEYSDIALIVQGRLEQTDYYEKGHKMKLSEQLTYILENNSRVSSPALSKNLEATPIESLPGNSTNNSYKPPTSSPGKSTIDTASHNSPGPSDDKGEKTLAELDNQIRSIKQKAEKDPVFDRLLEEIIGQKNEASTDTSNNKSMENNRTTTIIEPSTMGQSSSAVLSLDITEPQSGQGPKKAIGMVPDPHAIAPVLPQQNQFFLTSNGGLLMLPPLMAASNYVFLNGSQPTTTVPASNPLTETDIMKMPTLLVDDCSSAQQTLMPTQTSQAAAHQSSHPPQSQLPVMVTQSQIIVTSMPHPVMSSQICTSIAPKPKTLKTIAPKATAKITLASPDGDFYKEIDKNEPPAEPPAKPVGRPGLRKRPAKNKENAPLARSSPVKNTSADKKKNSAKSLFPDKGTKSTWDSELRELLVVKDRAREDDDDKMDVSYDDEELKREAMLIEAAFKTPVKAQPDPKDEPKEETPEDKKDTEEKPPDDSEMEEQVTMIEQTEVYLRNCNGPPRIKKKVNQSGATELFEVAEVVEETVKGDALIVDRKITILETPIKSELPKTPGKTSEMTPFSRAIEDQLQGMDLLSMPTPSVVIPTPGFPITPNVDLSTPDHHSNRPTDYSTSSSYYQPSDNEQNKSFELMMEEYRKEGKKKAEEKKVESVSEMKRLFNKNVIGQKNLNLMKKVSSGSESSSSSSSSSDSSDNSDSESDSDAGAKNEPDSPREYSFRKRNPPTPTVDSKETKKVATKKDKAKTVKKAAVKTPAPRKNPPRAKTTRNESKTSEQLENENEVTDDDFALHLSTDEDSVNKVNNERGGNRTKEEASRSTRKEEPPTEAAKQLIQDLYERGIHLLPKVSAEEDKPSTEKDPNALENLDVSSEEDEAQNLSRTVNPVDVAFDCKTFDEKDQVNLVYDSSKRRKKKVYDLNVLQKKIEADVYVESLDVDLKRFITFTPAVTILEYSPKKVPVKRKKSVKLEVKTKVKKQEEAKVENGHLDGSFKKEENGKKVYSNKLRNRGASDQKPADKASVGDGDDEKEAEATVSERLEGEKDDMPSLGEGDDDLMNFAVLGGATKEEEKKTIGKSREKRKLSTGEESSQPEKKSKTETEKQALLKNVNVDLFLNELHGGSKSTK